MKTSQKAQEFIKRHELLRLKAYLCPAGVPTIGWGSTKGVAMGMTITQEQAQARFEADLSAAEAAVEKLVDVPLTQGQFDALVSFVFNVGASNLAKSTLLRLLNDGRPATASMQFPMWCHARDPKTGKLVALPGLVKRRAEEKAMFDAAS